MMNPPLFPSVAIRCDVNDAPSSRRATNSPRRSPTMAPPRLAVADDAADSFTTGGSDTEPSGGRSASASARAIVSSDVVRAADAPPGRFASDLTIQQQLTLEKERTRMLLQANNVLREAQLDLLQRYRLATIEHAALLAQLEHTGPNREAEVAETKHSLQQAFYAVNQANSLAATKELEARKLTEQVYELEGTISFLRNELASATQALDKMVAKHETLKQQLAHESRKARQFEIAFERERSRHQTKSTSSALSRGVFANEGLLPPPPLVSPPRDDNAEADQSASPPALLRYRSDVPTPESWLLAPMHSLEPMIAMVTQLESLGRASAPAIAATRTAVPTSEPLPMPGVSAGCGSSAATPPSEAAGARAAASDNDGAAATSLRISTLDSQIQQLRDVCSSRPELRCAIERLDALADHNKTLRDRIGGVHTNVATDDALQTAFARMHKSYWHARAEEAVRLAGHWNEEGHRIHGLPDACPAPPNPTT